MAKSIETAKDRRNRLARERRAKLRAQKERRSQAAKKGWVTRRAKAELPKDNPVLEALKAELEEKKKEVAYLTTELNDWNEAKKAMAEFYLREETPEEKHNRMLALWRETEAMIAGPGRPRYLQLVMWMQRNGIEPKEFWAEYRRRTK